MPLSPEQTAEIAAARDAAHETRRATVPALEAMLFTAVPPPRPRFYSCHRLHGRRFRHRAGSPRLLRPRHPARVSEDAGLIRYLMRHRHSTPFEMCEIKYHVKLPIFVARQWIRPPHGQRERIFRTLLGYGSRVLPPRPSSACRPILGQPAGKGRCARGRGSRPRPRPAARRCHPAATTTTPRFLMRISRATTGRASPANLPA